MIHGVLETTNMGATRFAERIFDCVSDVDLDNGVIGHMEELAEGYTHIYKFVPGVKAGEPVLIVNAPAWSEDESRIECQRKDTFYIPAGTPFRAFVMKVTDEFAVNAACATPETQDAMAVGKFVSVDEATGKLVVADAAAEDAGFVGEIMRKRVQGGKIVTPLRSYGRVHDMFTIKVKALG